MLMYKQLVALGKNEEDNEDEEHLQQKLQDELKLQVQLHNQKKAAPIILYDSDSETDVKKVTVKKEIS